MLSRRMVSTIGLRGGLMACGWSLLTASHVFAMGYDSLACPELRERRMTYFNDNGLCAPGEKSEANAQKAGRDCTEPPEGVKSLPEADRTQVEMIIKVEARKGCAGQ